MLSKTRVVLIAVLIYERGAMMHRSGLRPMMAFQPPASAPAVDGYTLSCKGLGPFQIVPVATEGLIMSIIPTVHGLSPMGMAYRPF